MRMDCFSCDCNEVCAHICYPGKKITFFKVLVQMEMILRVPKTHPIPVKAKNSGIEWVYILLWHFLITTFFISATICLVLGWLRKHTVSERK